MFDGEEVRLIAHGLVSRIRDGSMPSDDAYWWARALGEMARKLATENKVSMFTNLPRVIGILLLVFGLASGAQGQTGPCPAALDLAVNPTWLCVQPSSTGEHNAVDPLNASTIARYDVLFFAPGVDTATGSPIQTIPVGKPTLNAQGVFWLQRSELAAIPVGQQYRGRAVAVGVTGVVSARSPESNPFGRASGLIPAAPALIGVR